MNGKGQSKLMKQLTKKAFEDAKEVALVIPFVFLIFSYNIIAIFHSAVEYGLDFGDPRT